MPTKKEILERREALEQSGVEAARISRQAYEAKVNAEKASLQELCAATGHLFAKLPRLYGFADGRTCVYCDQHEPADQGA